MTDLEFIENYVNGQLSPDEKTRFETALRTDPAVADALTFYMLAKHTAKVDARDQRRAEFDALRRDAYAGPVAGTDERIIAKPSWSIPMSWAAAASVVLVLGLGWYFMRDTISAAPGIAADATQQTDTYIAGHFDKLSTTMGGAADSLKQGVSLYNDKKFAEADAIFQGILTHQPDNDRALTYAGIVALRQASTTRPSTGFTA